MWKNQIEITGAIKFIDPKQTSNGNLIVNATLSRGSKEKGYENYKIRAYKENAEELCYIEAGTVITIKGWLSQDNWEKDGKKYSQVFINIKSWDEYKEDDLSKVPEVEF